MSKVNNDHKKWMNDNNIKTKHWNFLDFFLSSSKHKYIILRTIYLHIYTQDEKKLSSIYSACSCISLV